MTNIKMDHAFKDYFKVSHHLADLINASSFNGNQVILPDSLEPYDSDATTIDDQKYVSHERRRDVFMKYKNNTGIMLLGIENQTKVDSLMPLRAMIYNAFCYNQMLRSKVPLLPIHTLVFYYGEEKWESPQTLKEMFSIPDEMKDIMNDWKLHLISVVDIDKNIFKDKDNQKLIECTQKLIENGYDESCLEGKVLNKDVALAISSLVNSELFFEVIDEIKEDKINMCRALEQLETNAEQRGFRNGEKIGEKNGEIKGIASSAITILKNKLPYLSSHIIQDIENSSIEKLNQLISQILLIQREEDVYDILNIVQPA